jgi:uncharacterized protein (TIGR04255 family)
MNPLPKRLKKEPLIEAIWQAQFDDDQGLGDVLPGILFTELRKTHPALQLRRLPSADIPSAIARVDPNLRYTPKMLMEARGGSLVWQVGDRVITVNCRRPYVGWARFKDAVLALSTIAEDSGLIARPQRHSLRYIDLLTDELADDLSVLRAEMNVGDLAIRNRVQIRVELPDADYLHVVQIATGAQVNLSGSQVTGTVVDLETSPASPTGDWSAVRAQLDLLHEHSKALFFRRILTEESILKLDPEY